MVSRGKETSRIRVAQMDNLRYVHSIRRKHTVPNAKVRVTCGVKERVN